MPGQTHTSHSSEATFHDEMVDPLRGRVQGSGRLRPLWSCGALSSLQARTEQVGVVGCPGQGPRRQVSGGADHDSHPTRPNKRPLLNRGKDVLTIAH